MLPALIINPLSDHEFVAFVREHARAALNTDALQARLRAEYERAVVRERDLSGESTSVWYVYRDGSWTSGKRPDRGGSMRAEERDDLKSTAESIVTDAERLKQIEQRKLNLEPSDDEEVMDLATEAEELAEEISDKARVEKQIADEVSESP